MEKAHTRTVPWTLIDMKAEEGTERVDRKG